jgi:hypothetical protein
MGTIERLLWVVSRQHENNPPKMDLAEFEPFSLKTVALLFFFCPPLSFTYTFFIPLFCIPYTKRVLRAS